MSNTNDYSNGYGQQPNDDEANILMMSVFLSISFTIICCTLFPGECIVAVGVFNIFVSLIFWSMAEGNGEKADVFVDNFLSGILSGFIWIAVGRAKIRRRIELEGADESLLSRSLANDPVSRARQYLGGDRTTNTPEYRLVPENNTDEEEEEESPAGLVLDSQDTARLAASTRSMITCSQGPMTMLPSDAYTSTEGKKPNEDTEEADDALERGMKLLEKFQNEDDDALQKEIQETIAQSRSHLEHTHRTSDSPV